MIVTDFNLQLTGRPNEYNVRLELLGEAESVDAICEALRPLVGNIRITTSEVDADLTADGSYQVHSLPPQPGVAAVESRLSE